MLAGFGRCLDDEGMCACALLALALLFGCGLPLALGGVVVVGKKKKNSWILE
jgi:hypothetical protein